MIRNRWVRAHKALQARATDTNNAAGKRAKKRRAGLSHTRLSRRRPAQLETLEPRLLLAGDSLVISEFMARNSTSLVDEDGDQEDWIEVHNPTDAAVNLDGWHLSDDSDDLMRWTFPSINIGAGEHLLLFASGKDRADNELHTNFRLGGGGEYLALVQPDGTTVEFEYSPEFPEQYDDVSFGLGADLETQGYFTSPTPGTANAEEMIDDPSKRIVINEIMYHPASQRDSDEYIELLNVGTVDVNLTGWQISDGIDFVFPAVTLAPGEFLVVAASADEFRDNFPNVTNVVGPWTGHLSNQSEEIELDDAEGNRIDRVRYADEGDWSTRVHGVDDRGSQGWDWSNAHDGEGSSLELINPLTTNRNGQNWTASEQDGGTPGSANSVVAADIAPLISGVIHSPIIPSSVDPVTVTASVRDELNTGVAVTAHFRVDGAGVFETTQMLDDGLSGDGAAGDGVYGVMLPAQADGTIVEFFVSATDGGDNLRTWPAPVQPSGLQEANLLYQVEDATPASDLPIYRIIMTEQERQEIYFINRPSNAQMNATFITSIGGEIQVRYNVGVRERGDSSRFNNPAPYKINLSSDNPWKGITALNLNSVNPLSQVASAVIFAAAGLPAGIGTAVEVLTNGVDRQGGSFYAHIEPFGGDFADNHFPLDGDGNLYKGRRAGETDPIPPGGIPTGAGLQYQGEDQMRYVSYMKQTNTSLPDWSDVVELTRVLNQTSDEEFVEEVSQVLNIDQWLRHIALAALIDNDEYGLPTGDASGDDYAMYRGIDDPRFQLIPHDLDSSFGSTSRDIFRATSVPALSRLMLHPQILPRYYSQLVDLMDNVLTPEVIGPILQDFLGDAVEPAQISQITSFLQARASYVRGRIPQEFNVTSSLSNVGGLPRSTSSRVEISGEIDATRMSNVMVGGRDATVNVRAGTWQANITVDHTISRIPVVAYDIHGEEIERTFIDIWYDEGEQQAVSGTLDADTTWEKTGGPIHVSGELVVPAGVTLTIDPGTTVFFDSNASLMIRGRLVAEGTASEPIFLTRVPDGGNWNGIQFRGTMEDNRIAHAQLEYGVTTAGMLGIENSRLLVDHVTFDNTNLRRIRVQNVSLVVRNSVFTDMVGLGEAPVDNLGEHIWGAGIAPGGEMLIENNTFGRTPGHNDGIDFDGPRLPGPIARIIGNTFLGGGDDALDLEADAYIEGNLFMNYRKDVFNVDPGEANVISAGDNHEFIVVRNTFYNIEHVSLIKEGSFMTFVNNTVDTAHISALYFDLAGQTSGPGRGAYVDGNIFHNTVLPFDVVAPTTDFTVNRSIVSEADIDYGIGNLVVDPHFVDADALDFRLLPGSPAIGTGPNGQDMGAHIPSGASISGEPGPVTHLTEVTLTVGGPDIVEYRYRVNDGPFGEATSTAEPIELSGLADGEYTVYVIGKDSSGTWQDESSPNTSRTWSVDSTYAALRINELLAQNVSAVDHDGTRPDLIELYNDSSATIDISGMGISDSPTRPDEFVFPDGTTIGAGEYLVLYADSDTTTSGVHLGFSLDADGEGVYLFDTAAAGSGLLDGVAFGPQALDLSIGRNNNGDWMLTQPTFGAANVRHATGDPAKLTINEFLASPEFLFDDDFIELFNPDSLPVAIGGLHLTDDPSGDPARHQMPPLSFIAANSLAVLVADASPEDGGDHVDFRLSNLQEMIGLLDAELNPIDVIYYSPQVVDVSTGRRPDGSPVFDQLSPPTPGRRNDGSDSGDFDPFALLDNLRITEIMYHPSDGGNFEYVELQNTGTSPLELGGVKFTSGIGFTFPAMTLAPDEFIVVVGDLVQFRVRYGDEPNVAGQFSGSLSNGGENITLTLPAPFTALIHDFTYDDQWYPETDGLGFSLVIVDQQGALSTWNEAAGWFPSNFLAGSPGRAGVRLEPGIVTISEVLTSTTDPSGTWIELHNTLDLPINISGWLLSDNPDVPGKFTIPDDTILPASGYVVFTESEHFGNADNPGSKTPFSLDGGGGQIRLSSANAAGSATGFREQIAYGVSDSEVTLGRYENSTGQVEMVAMASPTSAAANSLPAVGPVVITEVMYHPVDGDLEYIELQNISDATVELFAAGAPSSPWQFVHGIEFTFPEGLELASGEILLVVGGDPDGFRTQHAVDANVRIVGPFGPAQSNSLSDDGELLSLAKPRSGQPDGDGPFVIVDHLQYDNQALWPVGPNGNGFSLSRIDVGAYGNDVANWQSSTSGGSPGAMNIGIDATGPTVPEAVTGDVVSSSRIDLGWGPAEDPESAVALYRVYRSGALIGTTVETNFSDSAVVGQHALNYQIAAVNSDGVEGQWSDPLAISIIALVSVRSLQEDQVVITFSEPIDSASAEAVGNYSLDTATVLSALLGSGGTTVTLTTTSLEEGQVNTLVLNGIVGVEGGQWPDDTQAIFTFVAGPPSFTVRMVKANDATIDSLEAADALLALPAESPDILSQATRLRDVINFKDDDARPTDGRFDANLSFPNNSEGDDDDFALIATASFTVPAGIAGTWTFGVLLATGDEIQDDSVRLSIDGEIVIVSKASQAQSRRLTQLDLAGGSHTLELVSFDRTGGAEIELFAAPGSFTSLGQTDAWRLVGDVAGGGLAVITEPLPPKTILWQPLMPGGSLVLRHDDSDALESLKAGYRSHLLGGQKLSLSVSPISSDVTLSVTVSNVNGELASVVAAEPGETISLENVNIPSDGEYVFHLSGDAPTEFQFTAVLNAMLEQEIVPHPLSQTASQVLEFSSQLDAEFGSAEQVLGAPNTTSYGNSGTAWAPEAIDGSQEFITVAFDEPVFATGVTIRETFGNGFVTRVDTFNSRGRLTTLWESDDPSELGEPVDFLVSWPQTSFLVDSLRITVDTDSVPFTREEIDAITLHGFVPGQRTQSVMPNNSFADAVDISSSRQSISGTSSRLAVVGTTEADTSDFYRFPLISTQQTSINVAATGGDNVNVELFNSAGDLLAAGSGIRGSAGRAISKFMPPFNDEYFVRISGDAQASYTLVVTRGAGFDAGGNSKLETAQDITNVERVLASVTGGMAIASEVSDPVSSPYFVNLTDGEGFRWDIQFDGYIDDGTNDAFNGGMRHRNFPVDFNGVEVEDNGREVIYPSQSTGSGFDIVRKVYVPEDQGFARYLEIVTNTGNTPRNYTVQIDTFVGSGGSTQLVTSSSDDTQFTVDDNWLITDDDDGSRDPTVLHLIAGSGAQRPSSVSASPGSSYVNYVYDLALEPGETQVVMHFSAQNANRADAVEKANSLELLELDALAGMSSEELEHVVNFILTGEDVDNFSFHAAQGAPLSFTTSTPRIGAHDFTRVLLDHTLEISIDDPTGYWQLSETSGTQAGDSSMDGRGRNKGVYIGPTLGVPGVHAGTTAVHFDGADDYVSLSNRATLRITGMITMEAWVQVEATDGIRNIIAKGHTTNPTAENYLRILNGQYQVGSAAPNVAASAPIPPEDIGTEKWTHLVGLYNGGRWELYRDGELFASSPNTIQGAVEVNDDWAIGARGDGTERFFQGVIDEVAIYDHALTPQRIADHYNYSPVVTGGTNSLDPRIELYDPSGELVAFNDDGSVDGRNALLEYVTQETGIFTARVISQGGQGAYILTASGNTGSEPAPQVVNITPADGSQLNAESFPESITVRWSEGLSLTTLAAEDLQVNGVSAVDVQVVDGSTARFILDSATNTGDGIYEISIGSGQVTDLQDMPGAAFESTFTLDGTAPRITSITFNGEPLPDDRIFPESSLTVEMTFDEVLSPPGDFPQIGLFNTQTSESVFQSSVSYDPATSIMVIEYPVLAEGDYSLSVNSFDGGFEDIVGNDLDGEPIGDLSGGIPSGDGVPGGSYSISLLVDSGPRNLDAQWQSVGPAGSLIQHTNSGGNVTFAGDTDEFDFQLAAGETIAVVASPQGADETLTISLIDFREKQLATVTASAQSDAVELLPVAVGRAGRYRVEITGQIGGNQFDLRILRNVMEERIDVGPLEPMAIDASRASAGIGRMAVIGSSVPQPVLTNVWAVRPATSEIVVLDPVSGRELNSLPAPDGLAPEHTQIGLTIAEGGESLLYINADVDPTRVYRLDPETGEVLSIETIAAGDFDGLGYFHQRSADVLYSADMDSDPLWTYDGDWEYGQLNGTVLEQSRSPLSAFTGTGVVGTVVNGIYSDSITSPQYATMGPIEVSGFTDVSLTFQRWLFVPHAAGIQASRNGTEWTDVWTSPMDSFTLDQAWTEVSYDLSDVANGEETLFIRWWFGPTNNDFETTFTGWNIDDVTITGRPIIEPSIFLSRSGVDVVRQEGLSGPLAENWTIGSPVGAIGSDNAGRVFGFFADGMIHEFATDEQSNSYLSSLSAPAADIEGMAFDGQSLYVSTATGRVITLQPDSGAIVNDVLLEGGGLFGLAAAPAEIKSAIGVDVEEVEPNDSIAAAQNIDTSFSLAENPNIGDAAGNNTSTTIPHATISGTGNGTYDFYSFTVSNAGDRGIFDIDFASEGGLDGYLRLYDPNGQLITENDDFDTSAGAAGSTSGLDSFIEFTFSTPGVYVIEVGSCCVSPVSDNSSYQLQVSVENHPSSSFEEVDIVRNARTSWLYLDDGSDQGTAWVGTEFDDSSWAPGNSKFGYGRDGETTKIQYGDDSDNRYPTTYFRKTFDFQGASRISRLSIDLLRDDGAAVYLNGVEVVRNNLAAGATFDSFALSDIERPDELEFLTFAIDPGLLVEGTNVLAVEIHNSASASDDLGFALAMSGLLGEVVNPDVDDYTVDLTGKVGMSVDVLLSGTSGDNFSAANLTLLDTEGQTVLATGNSSFMGRRSSNVDQGIYGFVVPADGVYTVRVSSERSGDYALLVTDSITYESEPNDITSQTFRSLDRTNAGLGALSAGDDAEDSFIITLEQGQTVTVSTTTSLTTAPGDSSDSLDTSLAVYGPDALGRPAIASDENSGPGNDAQVTFTATKSGAHTIVVSAAAGTGEYLLRVAPAIQPSVSNVILGSSHWSDQFSAALDANGLGDPAIFNLGVSIPDGADQLDVLPWTNLDQVTIVFATDMVISQDTLTLSGLSSGDIAITSFVYDGSNHAATWTLSEPLAADRFELQLSATVADADGVLLDGEWTEQDDTFPSGDGAAGGQFHFSFTILPGDATGDGVVDIRDVQLMRPRISASIGQEPQYSEMLDLNGSGTIDADDFETMRANIFMSLPNGPLGDVLLSSEASDALAYSQETVWPITLFDANVAQERSRDDELFARHGSDDWSDDETLFVSDHDNLRATDAESDELRLQAVDHVLAESSDWRGVFDSVGPSST